MMQDFVDAAIQKGYDRSGFSDQKWEDFDKVADGRDVVLYGVGNGAICFIYQYGDVIDIRCAIDRDHAGESLDEYDFRIPDQTDVNYKEMIVKGTDLLSEMNPDKTVILVTSLKQYPEICEGLKNLGFRHLFSYLCMEANRRREEINAEHFSPRKVFIDWCCTQPVEEKKVFVQALGGYCGHARQVVEQLEKMSTDLSFVWELSHKGVEFPAEKNKVIAGSKAFYYEMATAHVWIKELGISREIQKRPEQIYIQLKHWASVTLKLFGLPRFLYWSKSQKDANEEDARSYWKRNAESIDLAVVGSDFDERTFREGYVYNGEFLRAGSPRSDILFEADSYREKIRKLYHIPAGTKILLYAPTYRYAGSEMLSKFKDMNVDYSLLRESLVKRFGGDWVILLRLHPGIRDAQKEMDYPDFVRNASSYHDSEELVAASDAMLADYSSIMFEPAFIEKPVFLFIPDYVEYTKNEMDFLMPFEELPFDKAFSNKELSEQILNFNEENYKQRLDSFMKKYGVHEDGHASERAARAILELMKKK